MTTDLHVESAGDGSPAVVLVHAGIADRRMWDREFAALADRHLVVRYDVRGFGRSPDPTRDYFDHDDLLAVLDDIGIDRAVLVGASNGGRIVLDMAVAAPQRVRAMVLVGSPVPGVSLGAEVEADLEAEADALTAGDIARAREINLRWWVDGVGRDRSLVDPTVRATVVAWLEELLPRQAALPRARLLEIDGAAHLPNLEQPERFARLLDGFLAGWRPEADRRQTVPNLRVRR